MMIICKDALKANPAVKKAQSANSSVRLQGMPLDCVIEYMSNYLTVPDTNLPPALQTFVQKVTLGNPLYIRETLDELQESVDISVTSVAGRAPKCEVKDLDRINVSTWQRTAMVGGTICLIESLDPLEAAVLKMSTCFSGPFTLPDLAASTKSRWADATYFDDLRIYKAVLNLTEKGIIEEAEPPESSQEFHQEDQGFGKASYFQMRQVLIRAVGAAMLLEVQKKKVKRQALIDRALAINLPGRMQILEEKRKALHIPWYYEQAFRRMANL
jgi:predicted ATPase